MCFCVNIKIYKNIFKKKRQICSSNIVRRRLCAYSSRYNSALFSSFSSFLSASLPLHPLPLSTMLTDERINHSVIQGGPSDIIFARSSHSRMILHFFEEVQRADESERESPTAP